MRVIGCYTQRTQGICPGWEAGSLLATGFLPRGLPAVLAGPIITALAPVKVQLTWPYWSQRPAVRCALCCRVGESHHRTLPVNQPLARACVSLASRPELRTHKETVCLLPEPGLHLVCTRFLQFLNVLVFPSGPARGGLTQPHANGQRADVPHPAWPPAWAACLGALRGLVSARQAMKPERALSVTEAAQPPALCWRLAASTKC